MKLTSDIIVKLYKLYKIHSFISATCLPLMIVGAILTMIMWICWAVVVLNPSVYFYIFLFTLTLFSLFSLALFVYSSYQVECVLKVEVMKYSVSSSTDLPIKESRALWSLLQDTLFQNKI